jgi:hypothetical protein
MHETTESTLGQPQGITHTKPHIMSEQSFYRCYSIVFHINNFHTPGCKVLEACQVFGSYLSSSTKVF